MDFSSWCPQCWKHCPIINWNRVQCSNVTPVLKHSDLEESECDLFALPSRTCKLSTIYLQAAQGFSILKSKHNTIMIDQSGLLKIKKSQMSYLHFSAALTNRVQYICMRRKDSQLGTVEITNQCLCLSPY